MNHSRFLAMLAASTILVLAVIALLPRLGVARPSAEIAWAASLYADKTRIADAIAGPRILVVGGSGTLFSFDASLAARRLGMPVVNFGTHAGLGLGYILDRAARVLRPGDIVLLAPEYELLQQKSASNEYAIQITAFYDHAYLDALPLAERPNYLLGYGVLPSLVVGARTALNRPPQGRTDITLDALGDVRGNTVALSKGETLQNAKPLLRPVSPQMVLRLREFARKAADGKNRILVISPALVETRNYTTPAFRAFQSGLGPLFSGMGMTPLGAPSAGHLPPADMYDSVYHANDRGRARYTRRILNLLCETMVCRH
jgi:hypothetical protein